MSGFSQQAATLIRGALGRAKPGSLVLIKTRQLGFDHQHALGFTKDLIESLGATPQFLKLDDRKPHRLRVFSYGDGALGVVLFASNAAKQNSDDVVVDPGYAAKLRDARSNPNSPLHGYGLLVLLEDEIDTLVSAGLDLTAADEVLSPANVLQSLERSANSSRFRHFLKACSKALIAATRGSAAQRGRLFQELSKLSEEAKPDVAAILPLIGPWMTDTKFNDLLDVQTPSIELNRRLASNGTASSILSDSSSSPGEQYRKLEKYLTEGKIEDWEGTDRQTADYAAWERDRAKNKPSRTIWKQFRYAKGSVVQSMMERGRRGDRQGNFIVFEADGFRIATVYSAWATPPPFTVKLNGKMLSDAEAEPYVEIRQLEYALRLPPRTASWQFFELRVFAGAKTTRGTPHSSMKVALPPTGLPSFYLQAFDISVDTLCFTLFPGPACVVAESLRSYRKAVESEEIPELVGPLPQGAVVPVRIQDGPDAEQAWKFVIDDVEIDLQIRCEPSAGKVDGEGTPFVSAIHDALTSGGLAREGTYLSGDRSILFSQETEHGILTETKRVSPQVHAELATEQEIVRAGLLAPRRKSDLPDLHENAIVGFHATHPHVVGIRSAYTALLEFLRRTETVPTLRLFAGEYRTLCESVLAACTLALDQPDLPMAVKQWIWRLGAITDEQDTIITTTPLWPPAIAYAGLLSDHVGNGQVPYNRIRSLTPEAIVPCLLQSPTAAPMKRLLPTRGATGLWLKWQSTDSTRDVGVTRVRDVIQDRLKEFTDAFPQLVGYHSDAPLLVQFIGVLPDSGVVDGLENFLIHHLRRSLRSNSDRRPFQIRAEFYLENPADHTDLDERMSPEIVQIAEDVGLDPMHAYVTYSKRPLSALVMGPQTGITRYAHVTFVARGFQKVPSIESAVETLPSGRVYNLVPSSGASLESLAGDGVDVVAFGTKGIARRIEASATLSFALKWNQMQVSLTGGQPQTGGRPNVVGVRTLAQPNFNIAPLYDNSVWVVHLEPGLSLIPLTRESTHQSCLVHFTDQRDPTTSGFDEVTLTFRRAAFLSSIQRMCAESGIPSATGLLEVLNSLNGEWTLDLLAKPHNQRQPKLACTVAAAYALTAARQEEPTRTWIFAAWEDFHRVTGAIGLPLGEAAISPTGGGSDDIILFGVDPREPGRVRVLIVEVKSGASGATKAATQIAATVTKLANAMGDASGLPGYIVRSELARYILRAAERMYVHHVLDRDGLSRLDGAMTTLLEGEYDIVFESDTSLPAQGMIVNVDANTASESVNDDPSVRRAHIPWAYVTKIVGLIDPARRATLNVDGQAATQQVSTTSSEGPPPTSPGLSTTTNPREHRSATPNAGTSPAPTPESSCAGNAQPTDSADDHCSAARDPAGAGRWSDRMLRAIRQEAYSPPQVDIGGLLAIDQALADLDVKVYQPTSKDVIPGPQATAVHLVLAPEVHVSKLARSLDTLKLKLGIRGDLSLSTYERPGYVTIFVPHAQKRPVALTAFVATPEITSMALPFPAGITPENNALWLDLVASNHLLVAGTTGSGKTVYLQGVAISLSLALAPTDLELYLVDPKKLDFAPLGGLPHVRGEIITNALDATALLERLVGDEVPYRQEILSRAKARNLHTYKERSPDTALPYVVVIIDEYNELLMSLEKDERGKLEDYVCRLAQIGRALGIYLILATQRPSVDVVSGRIKANFPTRVSFRLPSKTDSQVILDEPGAETLLPGGDGLIVGLGNLRRFQAFFLDDKSLDEIVEISAALARADHESIP